MRGGESNHTRILLDGIELSDPISGVVDFAHLSIAGIERIEILRGAPSALWGSDAISGVINLISRKGGRSSLTHKSGSNQRHETTLQVATESEDFSMQASAHHFQTRGENISLTGSERDGYRNNTLQWGGQWRPLSETNFRFSIRRTHANLEYDSGFPILSDQPHTSRNRQTYLNTSLHTQTGPFKHQATSASCRRRISRRIPPRPKQGGAASRSTKLVWRDFERCLLGRPLHPRRWPGVEPGTLSPERHRALTLYLLQCVHDAELAARPPSHDRPVAATRQEQRFPRCRHLAHLLCLPVSGQSTRLYLASASGSPTRP